MIKSSDKCKGYIERWNKHKSHFHIKYDFQFTKGIPKEYKRSDLENPVTRLFCNNCGTAIGTKSPLREKSIILKVGTFDDPSVFKPEIAIFTCDMQKFHHIDSSLKSFDKRP